VSRSREHPGARPEGRQDSRSVASGSAVEGACGDAYVCGGEADDGAGGGAGGGGAPVGVAIGTVSGEADGRLTLAPPMLAVVPHTGCAGGGSRAAVPQAVAVAVVSPWFLKASAQSVARLESGRVMHDEARRHVGFQDEAEHATGGPPAYALSVAVDD
jgi:hypothetical protein